MSGPEEKKKKPNDDPYVNASQSIIIEKLENMEAAVHELAKKQAAPQTPGTQEGRLEKGQSIDVTFPDEQSRRTIESYVRQIQHGRKESTVDKGNLAAIGSYAQGVAEIPIDVEDMSQRRMLVEYTIFGSFDRAVAQHSKSRVWGRLFAQFPKIALIAVIGVISALVIYRILEPSETAALLNGLASLDYTHVALIVVPSLLAIILLVWYWRSKRKKPVTMGQLR